VLSLIVSQAQEDGRSCANPVRVRVIGAGRVREAIRMPNKDEVRRLIEAATEASTSHRRIGICGLRASELRGLRWVDVDLKAQLIRSDSVPTRSTPSATRSRQLDAVPCRWAHT
jgi:integrase